MFDTNLSIYAGLKLLNFFLQARTPPAESESSVYSLSLTQVLLMTSGLTCLRSQYAGVNGSSAPTTNAGVAGAALRTECK